MKIVLNRPFLGKEEMQGAIKVLRSGILGGNGPIGRSLENFMSGAFEVKYSLLTTSCTHAVEMAVDILGIKKGDEVIIPSFSFVSVANAVVKAGARPVFVDIEDKMLNIDANAMEERITKRTKAVICVHYAGSGCQMERIMQIARKCKLSVIEDAAQAVGSRYSEKFLGTIGDIGCFSFHGTKNFTCGEGGALLTNNRMIAEAAEIIREKGTNRTAFLQKKVDKYTWIGMGSSYVLSELQAAVLFAQLKKIRRIIVRRKAVGLRYMEGLKGLEKSGKIILPVFPADDVNWHIFYVRLRDKKRRERMISALRARGIEAASHFLPLHLSPYAKKEFGYRKGDFPVSEEASASLVRLPIYPQLEKYEQDHIISSLYKILD